LQQGPDEKFGLSGLMVGFISSFSVRFFGTWKTQSSMRVVSLNQVGITTPGSNIWRPVL